MSLDENEGHFLSGEEERAGEADNTAAEDDNRRFKGGCHSARREIQGGRRNYQINQKDIWDTSLDIQRTSLGTINKLPKNWERFRDLYKFLWSMPWGFVETRSFMLGPENVATAQPSGVRIYRDDQTPE